MAARMVSVPPPAAGVYRLARRPGDPFSPPDWSYAAADGTFGNRFDDPSGQEGVPPDERFRVIYCATQRAATFGETVARFRPSLSLLAALGEIDDDVSLDEELGGLFDPDGSQRGVIPADWRVHRQVGHTFLDQNLQFVDVSVAESLQYLRQELASVAARLNLPDVDLSALTNSDRELTQASAHHIHRLGEEAGGPYAGIRYVSRLNATWECWAIFDDRLHHEEGCPGPPQSFFPDDEDLVYVAGLFDLTIESIGGRYIRP